MMILPLAPPELVTSAPQSVKTDSSGFADTLAGVVNRGEPAGDALAAPVEIAGNAEAPPAEGVPLPVDQALVLLLLGTAQPPPPPVPATPEHAAETLTLVIAAQSAAPFLDIGTAAHTPAPPTAGDLLAVVQTIARSDIVGEAVLLVQPASPSLPTTAAVPAEHAATVILTPQLSQKGADGEDSREPPAQPGQAIEPAAPLASPDRVASTAAESPKPAEIQPRQIVEQIAPRLATRLETSGEFRITLQPESLGTIDVAVRVSPAGVQIQMAADDSARDLIQSGLAELRSALRSEGRELAIDVSSRLSGGFDPNNPFGRGASSWTPPSRSGRRAVAVGEPDEANTVAGRPVSPGRIDYWI